MKKVIIAFMALIMCASLPLMAQNISAMKVDPDDQAVVAMLWMVYSDLQMCNSSLNQSVMDNVSAIGHLNNAQSALKKANLDQAYDTLVQEISKRISKIKFYLVMNERRSVVERLQQLMVIIRNVLGASTGNMPNYGNMGNVGNGNNGNYGFNNNGGNLPNGSGFVPRPEIPVQGGQFGGSSNPSMPTLPFVLNLS